MLLTGDIDILKIFNLARSSSSFVINGAIAEYGRFNAV